MYSNAQGRDSQSQFPQDEDANRTWKKAAGPSSKFWWGKKKKRQNNTILRNKGSVACPKSVLSLVLGANFRTPILKLKDFIKSVLWSLSHLKIQCKCMCSCGLNVWLTVINSKREKPKITSNKNLCQISYTYSWSVCSQSSHSFQPEQSQLVHLSECMLCILTACAFNSAYVVF